MLFPTTFFSSGGGKYVGKVYHGTVTIGLNTAFGNATVPQNGKFAQLVYLGHTNGSTTNQSNIIAPRITLVGTTVQAVRNTGDASNTVVIYFAIIDWTTSAVDLIEYNSVNFAASSSATKTLTNTFDLTRSMVCWLGNTSSDTLGVAARRTNARLASATTVTCTSNSTHSGSTTFVVVQFKAAIIQSIQQLNDTYTSASAVDTKTITAVTAANSMIFYGGTNTGGSGYYEEQLTSSTNINLTRNPTGTAARIPNMTVVEFVSGVISTVQRGAISLVSATSNTATVTSVGNRALCNFNGYNNNNETSPALTNLGVTLTNSTTVTGFAGASSASAKGVEYELVEFL